MKLNTKTLASIIAISFAVLAVILLGQARKLQFDASADTLLTDDNKKYQKSQQVAQRYDPEPFILVTYKPKQEPPLSESSLSLLVELENRIQAYEGVKSTISIATAPVFFAMQNMSAEIDTEKLSWEHQRYSQTYMQKVLKNHPIYEDLLINAEQNALGLQLVFENDDATQHQEVIKKVLVDIKEYRDKGEFHLGGASLLTWELKQIINNDLLVFGSAISVIIILVLCVLFGSLRDVLLPMLCTTTAIVITIGILGLSGLKITVVSANVIALQIILTLALLIHILVEYRSLADTRKSTDRVELVKSTLKSKLKPSLYAGITTAIGFGSLIFSGIQPIISFGWMMVIALSVTLATSLLFFPALLIVFPRKPGEESRSHKMFKRWLTGLSHFTRQHPRLPLLWLVISVFSLGGLFLLKTDTSFINYFRSSTDTYKQLRFIDQEFGGSVALDVLYKIPQHQQQQDLILTAETLQLISKISADLQKLEAVGSITSVADFTRIAREVNGKPLTEYEISALYRAVDKKLRDQIFSSYFSEEDQELRLSLRIKDSIEDFDRTAFLTRVEGVLQQHGLSQEHYYLSNVFVLYEDIISRLVNSQLTTLLLVYIVMLLLLFAMFSSIKIAFIALLPNFATTAILFGFMGFAGLPLDLMTMTIAAVAMGISVDDTVHYIHRYLHETEQPKSSDGDALENTNRSVGIAMVYTTLIIILGFGSLIFSDFMPSVYFGILAAVAMLVALLADLTLLPPLLNKMEKLQK